MKISVIIPCYFMDAAFVKMTEDCVESLNFEYPDELIIVDDGSPYRRGLEWLKSIADKFIYYKQNQGFPHAVNTGLKEATGDILAVINNDIIFTPEWLTHLVNPLKNGYDISSIRTTDTDGWTTEDKITEGDKFGSCWAMRRTVYTKLGGLDERFGRGTFEDTDYRQRAMEAGFKIAKNHRGLVEHVGRATFDRADPDKRSFVRNKRLFVEKWGKLV